MAVRLYHKPLKAQVQGGLREFQQVFPASAHVGRVGKERQSRIPGPQFNGYLPLGIVPVEDVLRCGKTPVYDSQLADSGPVEPFKRTYPEVEVGIHRVFHQNGDVGVLEGVGKFLHQERVGRGAGTYPDYVHSVLDALEHVLCAGHFRPHLHAELVLDLLEPLEAGCAHSLETSRMGPGFPYPGTENMDSKVVESAGSLHYLFFGLGAAGAGNDHRPGQGEKAPLLHGSNL